MKKSNATFVLVFFCVVHTGLIYAKKIEDIFTCVNGTECNELLESETYAGSTVMENNAVTEPLDAITKNIYNSNPSTSTSSVSVYTTQTSKTVSITQSPSKMILYNETRNHTVYKTQSSICECDLTTEACDINCCCDDDCNDFHLTTFSRCEDYHAELYDSRYCYNRNFIDRNNTPFILEKLTKNLFCILYDNLPPTYSANNDMVLKKEKDLREAINSNKLTWRWEDRVRVPEYNISILYQDGDVIWKLYRNYVQPIELLQSGFTDLCSFKKTLKYLHGWKKRCLQTELTNANKNLFPMPFNNFTVISSPHLLNETYINLTDQICPRNTCIPLTNHYCQKSWKLCTNTSVSGSCLNGTCHNIVIGVRYLIVHNGSMGINSVDVYFDIGNASHDFYQYFEVAYEWTGLNKDKIFVLSGNPGYMFGKPLIVGTLRTNKTNNLETRYVTFNKTDSFLTLPLAKKTGECHKVNRYFVAFGEDVKLRCSVVLHVNNFSTSTCVELQNRTTHFLMKDSLFNITQTTQYDNCVSKLGNLTNNDTSSCAQILLDRVPQNVVTGRITNDRLYCSGLITSMHLNILYSALSKPESLTNYNILGVGLRFSEESDISWPKCYAENCMDMLKVDIITYVTFHDVSKPSKYYFVGGPNLDITLPYDFFYPFLSNSVCIKPSIFMITSLMLIIIAQMLFELLSDFH